MDFVRAAQNIMHTIVPEKENSWVRDFDLIIKWGLKILALLMPLTFLPWTFEIFEFNKQVLLLGVAVILAVLWAAQVVWGHKGKLVKSPLNWVILVFLAIVTLATIFSVDPVTSLLGFYGRFNGGLFSLIGYILFYFLVVQTSDEENNIRQLLGFWLIGVGLGALVLLLQLLGAGIFPYVSFTPLGKSLNSALLLMAANLPLAFFFSLAGRTWLVRYANLGFMLLVIALAFLIDYQLGWIGLIIASVVWLGFIFWKNESVGFQWSVIPSFILLFAVIGWPVATNKLIGKSVPLEINLSVSASWKVAWQDFKLRPVLGTGPETFVYGFSKYKPDNFNDSNFWSFRFDKAASEFAQTLATVGILGLAALATVVVFGLYLAWRAVQQQNDSNWYLKVSLVSAFLVLTLGQFFNSNNTTLAFLWWMVLGIIVSLASAGKKEFFLKRSPRATFSYNFGLAVIVLAALGGCYSLGRLWLADVSYAQAQQLSQRASTLDEASEKFTRAVQLNPWRDTYRIGVAQVMLALANREVSQPMGKTDREKGMQLARLQNYIRSSIDAARSAIELSSENVANWESLGSIYRGTALFARDAEGWVIKSFQKAIELEPKNPELYTELGKAYLMSASRDKQQADSTEGATKAGLQENVAVNINKALEQFDLALKLKANYSPARFNQAIALSELGKIDEAIDKLEGMRSDNPQNIDVLYELGNLYFAKASYNRAEEVFLAITNLVPNHTGAFYSLAKTYDKEGKRDKAITAMQKVLQLLPEDNANRSAVQKELDDLTKGELPAPVNSNSPAAKKP